MSSLDWKFSQVFGDRTQTQDVAEGLFSHLSIFFLSILFFKILIEKK